MRVQTTPVRIGSVTWDVSHPDAARSASNATRENAPGRVATDLPTLPARRWITRALYQPPAGTSSFRPDSG